MLYYLYINIHYTVKYYTIFVHLSLIGFVIRHCNSQYNMFFVFVFYGEGQNYDLKSCDQRKESLDIIASFYESLREVKALG